MLRLAETGAEVHLHVDSYDPGVKDPGAETDGWIWEFKAPQGVSNSAVSNQFKRAGIQASRLVLYQ